VIAAVQAEEDPLLNLPQGHVAFFINDILQGASLRGLDKHVGIHKAARCQLGQNDTNGAFA